MPLVAVFDLDNTLYNYHHANEVASDQLSLMMSKFANIAEKKAADAIASGRSIVKQRLGNTASSHSRILYISEAFRELNLQPDTEMLIRLEQFYWNTFLSEINLFSGVEDFLRMLRNNGTRLALVTDLTSSIQYRKISKLGLNRIFDFILTSEECGGDKSTGLPFAILKDRLQEDLTNAWFFGDSEFDHPNPGELKNIFFRKTSSWRIKENSEGFEFGEYSSLGSIIDHT